MRIVSGGQSGADLAALDAAISRGVEHGGWLPKGRKTENGPLPSKYNLKELSTGQYRVRTEKNVIDSDGTLICSFGPLSGGSALTEALTIKHHRPCLHIDFDLFPGNKSVLAVERWLQDNHIRTLNVAGPRASNDSRIYNAVFTLIQEIRW
ncbi:putative molybdenum carrier protein [Desulfogranum marinum]|uniref:putative molybdenum carrier protein n=1 Tax=Desulfogranum marinum TaxID=453220 RepID=UPI001966471A|nr:putative molybdenum carrier protein [Desulfogranum marinum]MBM9511962.1 putative molybdenum carrier protein [Desulfogranum marinum]